MRYAYNKNSPSAPIGVEPNIAQDGIEIGARGDVLLIKDAQQLAEIRCLLNEAEEILGWETVEIQRN